MVRARAVLLAALAVVSLPALAQAKGFGRRGSSGSSSSSSSSSGSHNAAPVGTPHQAAPGNRYYSGGSYYSGGRYYYGSPYYGGYYQPYYWGWGIHPWGYYGYGYYPYYGGPAVYSEVQPAPPPVTSNVFLGGLFTKDGAGLNLKLGIDGRRWGGNFDMLTLPSTDPNDPNAVTSMPLLKGHITYSVVSDMHSRIRIEGGLAGIGAPDVTYIGPDVGVSATLALVGPLALEGGAHWMPVPASIVDLDGAVGLNFGALGLRGGWRWVRLDDKSQGGGVDIFNGPMISVGVLF